MFSLFAYLCDLLYFALHVTGTGSFPRPLTAKEERECLEQIALGDEAAKARLIEHNLRLVAHIIKKYYSTFKDQDDLISIGTIGLIKAVSTFKPEKSVRFATYASRCIENEVLMHFRNKKKSAQDVYISDPIDTDKDGNSLTLMDVMSEEDNIVDCIDLHIKSEQLYQFIGTALDERERQIIVMRYGLGGNRPLTQREVAKKLDISRSYVSRIEKKAISVLRGRFEKEGAFP
ncbi:MULTISPECIES: RNA polymerase sporulation sigma factor SigK [unclassified Anaerotruncus]|uniref:RNA polymerase sporulation sigma factor SigK n=1 Tax=unclassified Anaerotruncus TaxID=2641626 RepID=UPI00033E2BD2|nr:MULTISPECIES: RNA polymerase sporulation sigma factor SigK [unclassified Anaerotruncus]MCI9160344.1 RNA polymerase sporulation sigma factor SigK [Anaerotruncus sp.]NCE76076.1 sigma-70 family RNA polymerase sigma factor [Anaerotruncus sp. X29]RKJ79042.1 sigma-70 family RNA polymerase sigma factor [Anaerotruncus sp. 1XD22-93]EOS56734.1 RNA polymerase sigma-K factor [Anaerotruncus sp. G3(2012)]NBK19518.1 sigma-70 family RNA polymerase sigma factor [Anaerotruncus sp. 1XD42-93]